MLNTVVPFIRYVSAPLLALADKLAPSIAEAAGQPLSRGDYTAAAFAVSSGFIAFVCTYWAAWAHARLGNIKRLSKMEKASCDAVTAFSRALLESSLQGVVLMRTVDEDREFLGSGKALFDRVLDSADAARAIRAIDELTENGTAFAMTIRQPDGQLVLRGTPVGSRAILYIGEQNIAADNRTYLDLLETLPEPVWLRDDRLALNWANRAFLDLVGAETLQAAIQADAGSNWSDRELAGMVRETGNPAAASRAVIVGQVSRTFLLNMRAMDNMILGVASDVSEPADAQASLQLALDAELDMVERLPTALAVFGADQKLIHYNKAYAQLWDLEESWLDKKPGHGEILDALRDKRRLPEQRNFAEWKQAQLHISGKLGGISDEGWHLPGGKSLKVIAQPHLQGGLFIQYCDISEQLRMESDLTLVTQVQKATLDTIDEGIAIIGTDGRLVLHNAQFSKMWRLSESELADHPHFAEIADLCVRRIGRDGIWGIVACGVNSATPERFGEWGKAMRADGRVISLALSRLPNGATVVTFTDQTDLENFNSFQTQSSHVAA